MWKGKRTPELDKLFEEYDKLYRHYPDGYEEFNCNGFTYEEFVGYIKESLRLGWELPDAVYEASSRWKGELTPALLSLIPKYTGWWGRSPGAYHQIGYSGISSEKYEAYIRRALEQEEELPDLVDLEDLEPGLLEEFRADLLGYGDGFPKPVYVMAHEYLNFRPLTEKQIRNMDQEQLFQLWREWRKLPF